METSNSGLNGIRHLGECLAVCVRNVQVEPRRAKELYNLFCVIVADVPGPDGDTSECSVIMSKAKKLSKVNSLRYDASPPRRS